MLSARFCHFNAIPPHHLVLPLDTILLQQNYQSFPPVYAFVYRMHVKYLFNSVLP